ncbi:small acid-soluble spore protein SspI [Chryseomicrobium palamuruense]|uniref:Small, acid-soluble spore protein I n=1 Tax=Chryseomicrobium palamuruense TaxID=682973 RepID=A0ABV8UX89_9BACL
MSFQIRQAIATSVAGSDAQEIYAMVDDAIEKGDEHFLPGLGVFFEQWWQSAEPHLKQDAVELIAQKFTH